MVGRVDDRYLSLFLQLEVFIHVAAAPFVLLLNYTVSSKEEQVVIQTNVELRIHEVSADTSDVIGGHII